MNSATHHAGPTRINVITAVLRVVVVASIEVAAFYLLPLNDDRHMSGYAVAAMALGILGLSLTVQVVAITRSPLPGVRAIEALASFITLLVVVFAASYYIMSSSTLTSFTQSLSRTDSLYFTITVFSTVGFGDIAPVSQTARAVVMGQMMLDLIVLGLLLKIIAGAVKLGRSRRANGGPADNLVQQLAGSVQPQEGDAGSR